MIPPKIPYKAPTAKSLKLNVCYLICASNIESKDIEYDDYYGGAFSNMI